MPRVQTRTACQRCRQKRARCDGGTPCRRCEEGGETCQYNRIRRVSKAELRAEIERLKSSGQAAQALGAGEDDDGVVCASSRKKNNSVEEGLAGDGPLHDGAPRRASAGSAMTTEEESSSSPLPPCFGQLLSWRQCRPRPGDPRVAAPTHELSTMLSLPPLPPDAYMAQSPTDTWTRTGWTVAHIRHLFDALVTWDCLPFCLVREELFLQDYYTGSARFCSSALVHAVLALATRLINEKNDDGVLPSGWLSSRLFFDEAQTIYQERGPAHGLPDIQALGILSLYHLRCGRETDAQKVAEAFAMSISGLFQRDGLFVEEEDEDYVRARAITYCGAVFLGRILSLATGQLFNCPTHVVQEDSCFQHRLSYCGGGDTGGSQPNGSAGVHGAELWSKQHMAERIFQLTECAHALTSASHADGQSLASDVVAGYTRCLAWYQSFLALDAAGSRTPGILFVHIYYHFCLLCAFRPLASLALAGSDIHPDELCAQAVQSILALAQSYDDLFTLRRVSGLLPYFICACGLFSLAMEDSGSHMDPVHLRRGDAASLRTAKHPAAARCPPLKPQGPRVPAHTTMSAAAHAQLLLAKMGSTHPAAAVADRLLRDELGRLSPLATAEGGASMSSP